LSGFLLVFPLSREKYFLPWQKPNPELQLYDQAIKIWLQILHVCGCELSCHLPINQAQQDQSLPSLNILMPKMANSKQDV